MMAWDGESQRHRLARRGIISIANTPDIPDDYELVDDYFGKVAKQPPGRLPEYLGLGRDGSWSWYEKKLLNLSGNDNASPEMQKLAKSLVKGHRTQRKKLESVYAHVTSEIDTIYHLEKMAGRMYRFLKGDAASVWDRRGSSGEACHTQSILMRSMLLSSGSFKPNEVKFAYHWHNSIPHTYLKVYLRDERKWIAVDPIRQDYVKGATKNPLLALGKHL